MAQAKRVTFQSRTTFFASCAIVVLILMAILEHVVAYRAIDSMGLKEEVVNVAGWQRSLLLKANVLALEIALNEDTETRQEIDEIEEEFFSVHADLTNQSENPRHALPEPLRNDLEQDTEDFRRYFARLKSYNNSDAASPPSYEELQNLVTGLNRLIEQYVDYANTKQISRKKLILRSVIVNALTFTVLGYLLFTRGIAQDQMKHSRMAQDLDLHFKRYDDSPFVQYELSADGAFLRVNKALEKILERDRSELVGKPVFDFLENGDEIKQAFRSSNYSNYQKNLSRVFRSASGRRVPMDHYALLQKRSDGVQTIIVLGVDRSSEYTAIELAKQARKSQQRIFNYAPIPMFTADKEGEIVSANSRLLEIMEVAELDELRAIDVAHKIAVAVKNVQHNGAATTISSKETLISQAGQSVDVMLYTRMGSDADGHAIIEGALVDITELETVKRQVQLSRGRFRQLYDETPVLLCSIDPDNAIVDANAYMLNELDVSRSNLRGMQVSAFIHPDHRTDFLAQLKRSFADSSKVDFKTVLQSPSGKSFPAQAYVNAAKRSETMNTVSLLTFLDTSDIAAAEFERDEFAARLVTAEKLEAVGQLAAGIAHEINTPSQYVSDNLVFIGDALNEILPAVSKLSAEKTSSSNFDFDIEFYAYELPTAISQSIEGMDQIKKIVRAMKDFSHPGQNRKETVDLNRLIQSVTTVARNEWKYIAQLTLNLDPALKPTPCASSSMNQVLINMIVNAAHAMEEKYQDGTLGSITVSTEQHKDHARIIVEDSGMGIPEDIVSQIFNPFFTTKEVGKGTGQGLSIVHRIVTEEHGGDIQVQSTIGEGTRFVMSLPQNEMQEVA